MSSINSYGNLIITGIISAIVGGSGITGIVFLFIRRYIEKSLDKKDKEREEEMNRRKAEEEKKKAARLKRIKVDDELQHCLGRLLFWLHKAIVTGQHNGDLEKAYAEYEEAEKARKDLDREIVAENEIE